MRVKYFIAIHAICKKANRLRATISLIPFSILLSVNVVKLFYDDINAFITNCPWIKMTTAMPHFGRTSTWLSASYLTFLRIRCSANWAGTSTSGRPELWPAAVFTCNVGSEPSSLCHLFLTRIHITALLLTSSAAAASFSHKMFSPPLGRRRQCKCIRNQVKFEAAAYLHIASKGVE